MRLHSQGLYAGSTIPKEMHLDLNRDDLAEFGKDILEAVKVYAPDKDEAVQ